jgi:very-short-patch-repair endonuclease
VIQGTLPAASPRLPSPPRRGVGGEAFSRGPGMTDRAQALRAGMTDAERKLWSVLRGDQLGVRFRRQLVIDQRYIADFCAPAIKLVVEVDGGQHQASTTDGPRSAYLASRGYVVLRFWNTEVLTGLASVADAIHGIVVQRLAEKTSPPTPLRDGEGSRLSPKDCT